MTLVPDRDKRIRQWDRYNPLTDSYDTPDGTSVAAYLVEQANCLADFLAIASIREKQRNGQ